jgi:nitrite reductase/ring-hydroxylating ferredoxin subunit
MSVVLPHLFVSVCGTSEIHEGELYEFDIQDKSLLVVRISDEFFVTDSTCTHAEADLSLGLIDDHVITCPLHRAKFAVRTGEVLSGPDGAAPASIKTLRVYSTKIENGMLLADI